MSDLDEGKSVPALPRVDTASQVTQPTQTAPRSTQAAQNTANVVVNESGQLDEQKSEAEAMREEWREMKRLIQQQQHQIAALLANSRTSAVQQLQNDMEVMKQQQHISGQTARRMGMSADTLPTPIPSNRYPSTAVQQGLHNRPSYGIPTYPFAESPSPVTPISPNRHGVVDEEGSVLDKAAKETTDEARIEAELKRRKDILSMVKGLVEPFYADSTKDKGTSVMDFVEKVETTMNDVLQYRPQYRLMVVRTFLREGAMRWMNAKIKEISDKAEREGRDLMVNPVRWDEDVRRLFIAAHVGTDTVELWLSKLSLLKLGSEKTPTPIELDSQFDTIARHVYPAESATDVGVDMLLTQHYSTIIYMYDVYMYNNIMRNQRPTTLNEWKTRLSEQFTAEQQISAMKRAVGQNTRPNNTGPGQGRGGNRGGYRGRGGAHVQRGNTSEAKPASVSAINSETNDRDEGEQETEGENDSTQLSYAAAAVGNNRGGRGGGRGGSRGGGAARGRGNGGAQWDGAEKRTCYNCKQPGHFVRECTNAYVASPNPPKEKADQ